MEEEGTLRVRVPSTYFIYVPYANTRSALESPRVLAYERRIRTFVAKFTCSLVRSFWRSQDTHNAARLATYPRARARFSLYRRHTSKPEGGTASS